LEIIPFYPPIKSEPLNKCPSVCGKPYLNYFKIILTVGEEKDCANQLEKRRTVPTNWRKEGLC
jgi:hypothetical protein